MSNRVRRSGPRINPPGNTAATAKGVSTTAPKSSPPLPALEVTDADCANADQTIAHLEAAGRLQDMRKALRFSIAQWFAAIRAAQRSQAVRGTKLVLPDGATLRVEKRGKNFAIYFAERGEAEHRILSYGIE